MPPRTSNPHSPKFPEDQALLSEECLASGVPLHFPGTLATFTVSIYNGAVDDRQLERTR